MLMGHVDGGPRSSVGGAALDHAATCCYVLLRAVTQCYVLLRTAPQVAVLLSIMLWGSVWGLTGMVLAVPMTAVCRIYLE